jgi:NAD(P)-dependent dehydrogenase (short-subunit alcohol dehydrogenase family)
MTNQRSVVVTGTGKGIGRAVAERLTADGWLVIGLERSSSSRDEGICIEVVRGDSADPNAHTRAAVAALRWAPLAGWVNNAGITQPTPLHELDADKVRRIVEINGLGYLWGCSAAVTAFANQASGGSIVNIGSIHGRASFADHAAYEFTKGGIDALTRSVAVTYGPYGIRANTVAPGGVMTPHLQAQIDNASDPEAEEQALSEGPPLGRIARAEEVGSIVAYLLSDEAAYISGQSIGIDGGWSASFGNPPRNPDLDSRYRRLNHD